MIPAISFVIMWLLITAGLMALAKPTYEKRSKFKGGIIGAISIGSFFTTPIIGEIIEKDYAEFRIRKFLSANSITVIQSERIWRNKRNHESRRIRDYSPQLFNSSNWKILTHTQGSLIVRIDDYWWGIFSSKIFIID